MSLRAIHLALIIRPFKEECHDENPRGQLHPLSTRVQRASPSDQPKRRRQAVSLAGLILKLNAEGEVKAWPHRVQLLLVDYFGCQRCGIWTPPETLLDWLRAHYARIRSADALPSSFTPLVVRLPAKRLTVRLFCTPGMLPYLSFEETMDVAGDLTRYMAIGLTPRQSEILTWVAEGKRDSEIAQIIHASTRTVSNHVHRILRKLRVETRGGAVAEAEFRLRRQP